MSLKRLFVTAAVTIITLAAATAGLLYMMLLNQHLLVESQEVRFESYVRADELRQSSDDLTRFARTFVVTGDPKYDKMYWDVLAIRNGEKPRPEKYEHIYWDIVAGSGTKPRPDTEAVPLTTLMEQLGFTDKEFAKLAEAKSNSDALVKMEEQAMNSVMSLVQGSDRPALETSSEWASSVRLLHDSTYHIEKERIMKPIDDFLELLDNRTANTTARYAGRSLMYVYGILGMLGIIIITSGVAARLMWRRITRIENVAGGLGAGSVELHSAARLVSDGANVQSTSVAQTSSSMNDMLAAIKHNAESAEVTRQTASRVAENAKSGVESVQRTAASMKEITGKIGIVDEITRKIELLALNAAVEAARAGEHGKGFAVVASEVSKLAELSKQSAAEISRLAVDGREVAEETSQMLTAFLPEFATTTDLVQGISASSEEQSAGAQQINAAVQQLNQVIHQNASAAEEMAAMAQGLSTQADELQRVLHGAQRKSADATAEQHSVLRLENPDRLRQATKTSAASVELD